jgi:hypothetical protein
MTETTTKFTGVKAQTFPVIDEDFYDATLTGFSDVKQSGNGPYVLWFWRPDAHPDVEVACATSIGGGPKSKGMEIARRLTGKSTAVDQKWGRDLKEKRPSIDWGPELIGSRAQIHFTKVWDEDSEVFRNRVVNVTAPGGLKPTGAANEADDVDESDFDDIPF